MKALLGGDDTEGCKCFHALKCVCVVAIEERRSVATRGSAQSFTGETLFHIFHT